MGGQTGAKSESAVLVAGSNNLGYQRHPLLSAREGDSTHIQDEGGTVRK